MNLRVLRIIGKTTIPRSKKVETQTSSALKNEIQNHRSQSSLSINDMAYLLDISPNASEPIVESKKRKLPMPSTSKSTVICLSDEGNYYEELKIKKKKRYLILLCLLKSFEIT